MTRKSPWLLDAPANKNRKQQKKDPPGLLEKFKRQLHYPLVRKAFDCGPHRSESARSIHSNCEVKRHAVAVNRERVDTILSLVKIHFNFEEAHCAGHSYHKLGNRGLRSVGRLYRALR